MSGVLVLTAHARQVGMVWQMSTAVRHVLREFPVMATTIVCRSHLQIQVVTTLVVSQGVPAMQAGMVQLGNTAVLHAGMVKLVLRTITVCHQLVSMHKSTLRQSLGLSLILL